MAIDDPLFNSCHQYFRELAASKQRLSEDPGFSRYFEDFTEDGVDELFERFFGEEPFDPENLPWLSGTGSAPNELRVALGKALRNLDQSVWTLAASQIEGDWHWESSEIQLRTRTIIWQNAREIWVAESHNEETISRIALAGSSEIHHYLDELKATDWLACTPLDRRFDGFPEFTDFGSFCIVKRANRSRWSAQGRHDRLLSNTWRAFARELHPIF